MEKTKKDYIYLNNYCELHFFAQLHFTLSIN